MSTLSISEAHIDSHHSYSLDSALKGQDSLLVISLDTVPSNGLWLFISAVQKAMARSQESEGVIAFEVTLLNKPVSMLDPCGSVMQLLPFIREHTPPANALSSVALLSASQMLASLTSGPHPFRLLSTRNISKERSAHLLSLVRDLAHNRSLEGSSAVPRKHSNRFLDIFYRQWEVALYDQQKLVRWSFLVSLTSKI